MKDGEQQNARRVSRAFELISIRYPENGVYMALLGELREGYSAFLPLLLPTPLYHTLALHPVNWLIQIERFLLYLV